MEGNPLRNEDGDIIGNSVVEVDISNMDFSSAD